MSQAVDITKYISKKRTIEQDFFIDPVEEINEIVQKNILKKYFIESLNELGFRVILLDKSILGYNSNIMMIEELKNEIEGLKMKLSKAIPIPSLVLMCTTLTIAVVFSTLMAIFYLTGIELVNLPTCFVIVTLSLALYSTSIYSIID